jgi:glycosyltransferase involved in cell wall biosynthesis
VTKTLSDALAPDHDTFILARTNEFDGRSCLETSGEWSVPNLSLHPEYDIPPDILRSWITENRLDAVIFNEEYDWDLVRACKETGVRTYTYLDYYEEAWRPLLSTYDKVLCSTRRTFSLVQEYCNACYIGWGIDTDLFHPVPREERTHTFFHNAGWAGVNYRKMTPAVIVAFHTISRYLPDLSLLVHSQRRLDEYPPEVRDIVRENDRITFYEGTLPRPGLYNKGQIYVYPAKLDGLGLTLLEALASGLPAIVTDAPPMNEFVHDGENGLLVRVATTMRRNDGIAFPETVIDLNDLAVKMAFLASHPDLVSRFGAHARRKVEEEWSCDRLRHHLQIAIS